MPVMVVASLSAAAAAAARASSSARSVAVTVLLGVVRRFGGRGRCGRGIQVVLGDVLDDAVGHEVPDRLPGADAVAAVGGADRHGGHLHQVDPVGGQARLGELVAGAGDPDELGELEQLVGVLPGQDLGQRVGAGDEEQLGVGALGAQVAQGVDGVGRAVAVDVDPRDGEARVGCRRDDGHQVAVLGRGDVAPLLLPGLARWGRRRPRRGRAATAPRRRRRGDRGGWGRRSHPSPRAACVRCSGVAVPGVLGPVRLVVGGAAAGPGAAAARRAAAP